MKIGVGVVSSSILPARDSATLESTFKASTGKTLEPLSVSLTEVHTVEASYSLVLNYDVEESKFGSFKTVIEDTLNTEASEFSTSYRGFIYSMVLACKIYVFIFDILNMIVI